MFLLYILTLPVLLIIVLKIYILAIKKWCDSRTCLVGKTAIVTGANTGIGYETALDLAMRGARVILACKDLTKANRAKEQIIEETGNKDIEVKRLNLSSFQSVRAFAADIMQNEERLDILCNNAGAAGIGNKLTEDGRQIIMQINYYSNFLLTNLLIDLLKQSAPSRIINVSSRAANHASEFNVDNLDNFPGHWSVYCNSKLCNILFTQECARRLKGSKVAVFSVHPGVIYTTIFRKLRGKLRFLVDEIGPFCFKNPREGAQTSIHACVAKGIERYSGEHFAECEITEPYKTARSPELGKKLWENTVALLNLKDDELGIY